MPCLPGELGHPDACHLDLPLMYVISTEGVRLYRTP